MTTWALFPFKGDKPFISQKLMCIFSFPVTGISLVLDQELMGVVEGRLQPLRPLYALNSTFPGDHIM